MDKKEINYYDDRKGEAQNTLCDSDLARNLLGLESY
jgi:hypothetical protein